MATDVGSAVGYSLKVVQGLTLIMMECLEICMTFVT